MKAIDDRIAAMEAMVAKLAAAPGAGRSAAAFLPGGDDDDESRDPAEGDERRTLREPRPPTAFLAN